MAVATDDGTNEVDALLDDASYADCVAERSSPARSRVGSVRVEGAYRTAA